MHFPSSDIPKSFAALGLKATDTVMIHGDAGVAAQYLWDQQTTSNDKVSQWIKAIIDYFDKGTVIVPAFTYSATKGEIFIPSQTPSEVGLFSEKFRLYPGVIRSLHPIFSLCSIGHQSQYFMSSSISDCFGKNTFFDRFYQANGKILTLGCQFERATYTHYVEQSIGVSYRYFKYFDGLINNQQQVIKTKVRYFVRDININAQLELSEFEHLAISENKMIKHQVGRFLGRVISAVDFYDIGIELINKNPHGLIIGLDK